MNTDSVPHRGEAGRGGATKVYRGVERSLWVHVYWFPLFHCAPSELEMMGCLPRLRQRPFKDGKDNRNRTTPVCELGEVRRAVIRGGSERWEGVVVHRNWPPRTAMAEIHAIAAAKRIGVEAPESPRGRLRPAGADCASRGYPVRHRVFFFARQ